MMKNILIVDDSAVFRLMIIGVLKKGGIGAEFTQADDGIAALELLNQQQFNLIITDLNMPNMDGIELLKNVRQNKLNKFVKTCVLSGESEQEMETEVKAAGANLFMLKPFDPPKFLNAVKKLIS